MRKCPLSKRSTTASAAALAAASLSWGLLAISLLLGRSNVGDVLVGVAVDREPPGPWFALGLGFAHRLLNAAQFPQYFGDASHHYVAIVLGGLGHRGDDLLDAGGDLLDGGGQVGVALGQHLLQTALDRPRFFVIKDFHVRRQPNSCFSLGIVASNSAKNSRALCL